jgi:hypothetical protein
MIISAIIIIQIIELIFIVNTTVVCLYDRPIDKLKIILLYIIRPKTHKYNIYYHILYYSTSFFRFGKITRLLRSIDLLIRSYA